jgi:F-type H+-transporting ATPase subunit epsilon
MKLTVWLPTETFFEEEVTRIKAEAEDGWFGLLPKHIDFVTALVPGILSYRAQGKPEEFLAIDQGILVKCGPDVLVCTRSAVRAATLEELETRVETDFRRREESEREAHAAEARFEADLVRHLMESQKNA